MYSNTVIFWIILHFLKFVLFLKKHNKYLKHELLKANERR